METVARKLVGWNVAIIVLLLQTELISYTAYVAAETSLSSTDLREARISLIIHALGGLLVVLSPAALYKPRGKALLGRRKQRVAPAP